MPDTKCIHCHVLEQALAPPFTFSQRVYAGRTFCLVKIPFPSSPLMQPPARAIVLPQSTLKVRLLSALLRLLGSLAAVLVAQAAMAAPAGTAGRDALQPIAPAEVGGIVGARLDLWRSRRLWRVAEDVNARLELTHLRPFKIDPPPGEENGEGYLVLARGDPLVGASGRAMEPGNRPVRRFSFMR